MIRTEKLLMLALLVSVTSSMLYKRYKPRWPTLSSSSAASSSSSPSQMLQMRKQLDAAYKSKSRFGTRSKLARDTCRAHPLTLELEPPLKLADQCATVSVLSYGCRGGCSSYSQVDPRNATNIIHSCSCCQPLRFMISIALLQCRNGHNLRVPFKEVLACSCRPCYAEEATKDYIRFDDLLSKPAVDTPLPIG
uniref:Bursicon n=1 Tax=Arion vulgaris TaxID=1028688 RepID=A0A0B6Y725_9EUPU